MASTVELRAILRDEITAGLKGIEAELKKVRTEGLGAGDGINKGLKPTVPTIESVTAALGKQVAQLRAQRDAMKTDEYQAYAAQQKALKAEIEAASGTAKKGGMDFAALGVGMFGAAQAVSMLKEGIVSVVSAAADFDSLNTRLRVIEGSASGGARAMKQMQELARQPGIGLEQAASAYAQIRSMNRDNAEAVKIIDGMAKANAAMGGGAESFGRAMYQVTQMMGKGKITAEDMHTIAESMPNFKGIMQNAFGGMSTEMINAKYNIDEILVKIADAAQKLPPAGDTIKNNFDNIADSWKQLKANLVDSDFIKSASGALARFLDTLANSPRATKAFTDWLTGGIVKVGLNQVTEYFSKTNAEIRRLEQVAAGAKTLGNTALYNTSMEQIKALKEGVDQTAIAQGKSKAASDAAALAHVKAGAAASEVHKEFAKFDVKTKIKEENEWYEKQKVAIGHDVEALSELNAVHKQHLAEMNKKPASTGGAGNALPGLAAMIAEKTAENNLRERMDQEGIDESIQSAIIARDKEIAVAKEKYRKLAGIKRISTAQLRQLHALEVAEIYEINRRGNARIIQADADADAKTLAKEIAVLDKKLHVIDSAIRKAEAIRDKAKEREKNALEELRKMREDDSRAMHDFAKSSSDAFATMADVAEVAAGKQSAMYKGMFAVSKSFAIANATLAMYESISDAMSKGFPQNIALMAAAAAQGATVIANIQSVGMAMRETGGSSFGGSGMIVGEKRPEYFQPTTPGQIHNSVTNSYGGDVIHIHTGLSVEAVEKVLNRSTRRVGSYRTKSSH